MAASAPVDSVDATETVPSSSISMRVPVSSWMERNHLPPGPMTAPIFSGLILRRITSARIWKVPSRLADRLGHFAENEEPALLACVSAFRMISG